MRATQKQYCKAVKLYEKIGPSAVYKYALEIGIDEYSECIDCDAETPDCNDGSCLVCGSMKGKVK